MYTLDKPQQIRKSFAITSIIEKAGIVQNDMLQDEGHYIDVEGYASRMYKDGKYVIDSDSENIDTFSINLDRLRNGTLPLLYNHQQDKPIGKILEAVYDKEGLKIKARVYKHPDDALTNFTYHSIKNGIISAFSVGVLVRNFDMITQDNQDYLQLSDCELLEVSAVSTPANPEALFRMTNIKSVEGIEKSVTLIEKSAFKQENQEVCSGFECAISKQKEKSVEIKEEEKEVVVGVTEAALEKLDEIVNPEEEVATPVEQPQIDEVVVPEAVEAVTVDTSNDKPSQEPQDDLQQTEGEPKEKPQEVGVTLDTSLDLISKLDVTNMEFSELEKIYEVLATMAEKIEEAIAPEVVALAQEQLATVTAPAA